MTTGNFVHAIGPPAVVNKLRIDVVHERRFHAASVLIAPLTGKSIALYSLKETVLRRVAELLKDTVSDVTITTFHDKTGGSSALRSAARNADVLVIATAAAKHAATNFIEGERGSGAVTLKPDGQGRASMERTLRTYAKAIDGDAGLDR